MQRLAKSNTTPHSHKVCWYLTERCHLSCSFCYAFKGRSQPSAQNLFAVGDALVKQGITKVNLAGGEPLLNSAVVPVINKYAAQLQLSLTTSLSLPISADLVDASRKLERICVSLDAVNTDLGMQIRGDNYSMALVKSNIEELRCAGAHVHFNTVVGRHNIDHLPEVANYIAGLGRPTVWRLFQITCNQNSTGINTDWLISTKRINSALDQLRIRLKGTHVRVETLDSQTLNSRYLIVLPNGDLCHPQINDYKPIGSVLESAIVELVYQCRSVHSE